jgi:putative nucleotidyltransferase with HDIG domain
MMSTGITREGALKLLHQHLSNPTMIKHSLASEAVLAALAEKRGEDREKWALAGLLHDLDYELTGADPAVHGQEGARMLAQRGVDPEIVDAIRRHNRHSCGEGRTTPLDHALAAGETITGLIVATALILPDKKLASVRAKSVTKRMKDRTFAAGVDRGSILECGEIGLDPAEFVAIALAAMQEISGDLGL